MTPLAPAAHGGGVHPDDRRQLAELVATQEKLRRDLNRLDSVIALFLKRTEEEAAPVAPPAEPPPLPDISSSRGEILRKAHERAMAEMAEKPRPAPESLPVPPIAVPPLEKLPAKTPERPKQTVEPLPKPPAQEPQESLEMRLGSVWLVRLGVVMLLTGLVFFGNYAYHNFIGKLGPGGRLALLYLAGGGLCAGAAWIERGREAVRNFARVLAGGGVATLYYATYAAHFVPKLRIIDDPVTGGGFLLLLAGGIAWFADRKRSETLAAFAILLSFYTGTINPIAGFTLFSNLVLTALAVFFLVRHRWTTLSLLSLAGAYGSFAFWRYLHGGMAPWAPVRDPAFFASFAILCGYWLLFTAGLFLCKAFPARRAAAFLSFNNGVYFALASVLLRGNDPASYWLLPCTLGAACLGLAALAARRMEPETLVDGAYLAQGLALVSLGLAAKLSGYELALTLGLESAVLLTCCRVRHGWIYRGFALLCGLAAFLVAMVRMATHPSLAVVLGGLLALLFLYNARWSRRLRKVDAAGSDEPLFQPFAAAFVVMALVVGVRIVELGLPQEWRFVGYALATVLFAVALPLHGLPELAFLGQLYLLGADLLWLEQSGLAQPPLPWWNPALLVAATLAMVHWWQKRGVSKDGPPGANVNANRAVLVGQSIAAFVLVLVLYRWLDHAMPRNASLWVFPFLALVFLAYGSAFRALALMAAGQVFIVLGAIRYFFEMGTTPPAGLFALLAVAGVAVNGSVLGWIFRNSPRLETESPAASLLALYRLLPLWMYVVWGFQYLERESWFAFFAGSALALFGAGAWFRNGGRIRRSGLLLAVALGAFCFGGGSQVSWQNGAALAALFVAYHAAMRKAAWSLPEPGNRGVVYALVAVLWLFVTRWVRLEGHGFYLTIAWAMAAAAVLGAGIFWRDRSHRHAGLALLAAAVGRIVFVDVWQLESGARALSFLVLGVVLPAFGYVYNRFAERVRN